MTGRIRRFERFDAPLTIELHKKVLLDGAALTPDVSTFIENFYEKVLFEHPWAAEDLPSLVYEDSNGEILAFLGILHRSMVFRDRLIRIALITRFMADPDKPAAAIGAAALFRKALRGPQDLSLADVVNEPGSRVWEASRAVLLPAGSLWWSTTPKPLRDATPTRLSSRSIETDELLHCIEQAGKGYALRPNYNESALTWLLGHLEDARHRGTLHRRLVVGPEGKQAGWYVYYANPGGFNGVQQIGVLNGSAGFVLQDLLCHAASTGGSPTTRGRADPPLVHELQAERFNVTSGPRMYAHSRDAALLLALTSGDCYLTRLEGEF